MLKCILYLTAIGAASFVIGRLLPKSWLHEDRFPFRPFAFERQGKRYEKLRIKSWQNKLPDMSRLFKHLMPAKKMNGDTLRDLPLMIKETCVAECIHLLLPLAGLYCLRLWPGAGGIVVTLLYFLGNLPFVLIQRYNRPRLQRLCALQQRTGGKREATA
ncbi:MAG: glycosyl-4,4'-diaponeurosporenoate acyltransferase [bacterium]|nr:glycosyl-4,4'-diaponeurosporenoate acyltransferase [bacterium]